jgi:hypothetical protein
MVLDIETGLVDDAKQGSISILKAMILVLVLLNLSLMWQTRHPKE